MSLKSNRRTFLATSAAIATSGGLSNTSLTAKSYDRILGANERLGVGLIGHGGMGSGHAKTIAGLKESNNLDPIAVADCWKTRADSGAQVTGAPNAYQDFRKVLDHKEIDYVTIATPEHWHCDMTLAAFDAGKDVYCEKPMTHTLEEGVKVFKKQKQTGRSLQVGVQGMSDDSYISARKAIDDGVLGQVVQAQIEYVRRYGEQGPWRVPDLKKDMP